MCHAWIIPQQNASKIVKISEQVAKLWRKLKWLVFFLGHGVDTQYGHWCLLSVSCPKIYL